MITINDLNKSENFFLMAGPCVIEGEDMALRIAEKIVGITERLHIPYVFKGSYRKANRSRRHEQWPQASIPRLSKAEGKGRLKGFLEFLSCIVIQYFLINYAKLAIN